MELEQTPIWADIRKIISDGPKQTRFEYIATLHTADKNIKCMKVVMVDVVRDYVSKIGDQTFIEVIFPLGDYIQDVYPNRGNLELTLARKPLNEIGDSAADSKNIQQERFKAVFLPNENLQASIADYAQFDKVSLNIKDIQHVKLMLLNRSLEPLRIKSTGGIFKMTKIGNVIQSLMTDESKKILVDGKQAVDGIQMVNPNNEEVKKHIIIPQGTHITSLPTFCQEKMGGVYNAGIGTYLQSYKDKMMWFIYPLFNNDRFKENVNKAVFYSVPTHRYTAIERTFRKQGNIIYILSTSSKTYKDEADNQYMDKGVGFRMTDARSMMKKPIQMTENGPVGKRGQLNNEVALKSRDDDLNYAPVSNRAISSNPFSEYSRVLERNGGTISLVWENADMQEIYPGMPCKYVFMHNNNLKEIEGVILFCHSVTQMQQKGITTKAHKTQCMITMFMKELD